jgi:putative glycosyltransferase
MRLSIVATLYSSAPYVEEFCRRATAAAKSVTDHFEIVLVNDGSPDNALDVALRVRRGNPHLRIVDLARNFGHHKAMMTGLAHARGELVFLIDSDLEEDPELLSTFLAEMQRTGADVVHGVQRRRKGGWFERVSGAVAYKVFNAITKNPIPESLVTVRLMTRRYVRALVEYQEREMNIGVLFTYAGFLQIPFPIDKRHKGTSTYNLGRKFSHFVNSVTSFSSTPLVFIFYMGFSIAVLAGIYGAYLVGFWLTHDTILAGWSSLIVSVWFLGGLTLLSLGVIGIYLSKVFSEVKQRPFTTVREIYEAGGDPGTAAPQRNDLTASTTRARSSSDMSL